MSYFLVALIAIAASAVRPRWDQLSDGYSFDAYLSDYKKSYSGDEYAKRRALFVTELASVLLHNSKPGVTYRRGINHMSDWTKAEKQRLNGGRYDLSSARPHEKMYSKGKSITPPLSIDYRTNVPAVLTAVKDQGFCGDCWAHSVTEAIESSYALTTGLLYVLSQQQVTSCTPPAGKCYSCNGSFPSLGYEYVATAGLAEEWLYSFESFNGSFPACRKNPTSNPKYPLQTSVNISGYLSVSTNNQLDTMTALKELGPLSVVVDSVEWFSYESGIFNGCSYAKNITINHAVLLVGYGTENGSDYWIVRNSFSPAWGERGYIRLAKPSKVECGWDVGAKHSSGCYGVGPDAVWTCGECGILFNPQFPVVLP